MIGKAALALLLLAGAAGSGGRWEPSHGPEGGPAFAVAVAPSAPEVVYAGTGRGVFRSVDGGRSWAPAGLAGRYPSSPAVTSLAVDPGTPTTVYAGLSDHWQVPTASRDPVFKTTNGGRTWRALRLRGQVLAIGSTEPATVYAAAGGPGGTSRLFRSTDGGRSWHRADRGLPSTSTWALAFDPTSPATVYAALGPPGVFESSDGGARWRRLDVSPAYRGVTAIAVDPPHPRTLYAGTDAGVIRSLDGGDSWRLVNAALGSHGRDRGYGQVSELVVDPGDSRTLYATAGCTGYFKSTDGGHRWSPVNSGLEPRCEWANSLALGPRASQTLYATSSGQGVFKSLDGGAHWQTANHGLSLSTVFSLATNPGSSRTVYAAAGDLGLFKSGDAGAHWRRLGTGPKLVEEVALDRINGRNILAVAAGYGIVRSADGGRTWVGASRGVPARGVNVIAISGKAAYAGGRHLFGSSDGGRTWRQLDALDALGPFDVQALAIAPGNPSVVYAGLTGFGNSDAGGLYESSDAGSSWRRVAALTADVGAIALDPGNPATVYVAGGRGVFRSTGGGTTWQRADAGLPRLSYVTALAIDPVHPTTLYAAVHGHGVFASTDSGQSWHALDAGLTVLDVRTLALDATGRTLYAGTSGAGAVRLRLAR